METINEKEKQEFRDRFRDLFLESLTFINSLPPSYYIAEYSDWPKISLQQNGMPTFSKLFSKAPLNYVYAFMPVGGLRESPKLVTEKAFIDLVKKLSFLRKRLLPQKLAEAEKLSESDASFSEIMITHFVQDAVDRYIHLFQSKLFDQAQFDQLFGQIENGIYYEQLPIEIAVPILFINFPFEELRISEKAVIKRMDESFQLARASIKAYGPGVHDSVMSAATHALHLEGWSVDNFGYWPIHDITSDIAAYPLNQIDLFFAALRAETGYKTGYAQLLAVPQNWILRYTANLSPLHGTSIRAYPLEFERFYWTTKQLPSINEETLKRIAEIWGALFNTSSNRLKIAATRLNMCFLRDIEEDIIIDAIIGLESALSDGETQELTHKLSLRIAALSKYFSNKQKSPIQTFNEIKNIYKYRSALIHGSPKANKKRVIQVSESIKADAIILAVEYLREVVRTLTLNNDLCNSSFIDEHLLLGNSFSKGK